MQRTFMPEVTTYTFPILCSVLLVASSAYNVPHSTNVMPHLHRGGVCGGHGPAIACYKSLLVLRCCFGIYYRHAMVSVILPDNRFGWRPSRSVPPFRRILVGYPSSFEFKITAPVFKSWTINTPCTSVPQLVFIFMGSRLIVAPVVTNFRS